MLQQDGLELPTLASWIPLNGDKLNPRSCSGIRPERWDETDPSTAPDVTMKRDDDRGPGNEEAPWRWKNTSARP